MITPIPAPALAKRNSPACERNRWPILEVLQTVLAKQQHLLEVGSGTGQHAVYFAPQLPHLMWQTSDLLENHPSILAWQQEMPSPNLRPPLLLDMSDINWASALSRVDAVFTANTCHIMAWEQVQSLIAGAGRLLAPQGLLLIYGPFNDNGTFTSASNAEFDASLRQRAAHMGLRDWQAVDALANQHQLRLLQDFAMPANNRLLLWQRD